MRPRAAKCPLPSSDAAKCVLENKPGAVGQLVLSAVLRSALIAPGMLLVGVKPAKALLGSVISSIFISTFVVTYMGAKTRRL